MSDLQVANVGSIIELTVRDQNGTPVNVSAATLKLFLRSPLGRLLAVTPVLAGSGTDGKIRHTTSVGDLDAPGVWMAQVTVTMAGVGSFNSSVTPLPVLGNLA
jgi:hypothetical protein